MGWQCGSETNVLHFRTMQRLLLLLIIGSWATPVVAGEAAVVPELADAHHVVGSVGDTLYLGGPTQLRVER